MEAKLGLPSNLLANLSLEESLARIWRLNPEAVEIVLDRPHVRVEDLTGGIGRLKRRLTETLGSLSPRRELSVHANFQQINPSGFSRRSFEIFKACLEVSAEVGAKVLVLHPGWLSSAVRLPLLGGLVWRGAWSRLKDFLRRGLNLSADYGVILALENVHGVRSTFSLPDHASKLAGLNGLAFTFDVGHAYIEARKRLGLPGGQAESWTSSFIRHLQGRIAHIHLHDSKGLKDTHLPPGEGEINFTPIVQTLKKTSFKGQVILEIWDPENPQGSGRKALEAARRLLF